MCQEMSALVRRSLRHDVANGVDYADRVDRSVIGCVDRRPTEPAWYRLLVRPEFADRGAGPSSDRAACRLGKRTDSLARGISAPGNRPYRGPNAEVEDDRSGDNRHRPGCGLESAISFAEELHHTARSGKPKRTSAGQENCIGLTNKTVGGQDICLAGTRSTTAHVNDRGNEAVEQDHRAAGSGLRIGPVSDTEARAPRGFGHKNTERPGRAIMICPLKVAP